MTELKKETSLFLVRALVICMIVAAVAFAGGRLVAQDQKPWIAPDDATKVTNPFPSNPENLAAGQDLYKDNCVLCHGEKGKGDGIAARTSKVPPTDFTDAKLIAAETDGSLFWKMTEGRGNMPSWKDTLSEKERWQLVDYIRKLNKDANPN